MQETKMHFYCINNLGEKFVSKEISMYLLRSAESRMQIRSWQQGRNVFQGSVCAPLWPASSAGAGDTSGSIDAAAALASTGDVPSSREPALAAFAGAPASHSSLFALRSVSWRV
jgi:hypothetical protein